MSVVLPAITLGDRISSLAAVKVMCCRSRLGAHSDAECVPTGAFLCVVGLAMAYMYAIFALYWPAGC